MYSWGSQILIDMHKAIVKTFSFLEVIQVIRGRQRSVERQTLDSLLQLYSWDSQLSFDMHKAIVKTYTFLEVIQVIRGRKRSLEGQTLNLLLLYLTRHLASYLEIYRCSRRQLGLVYYCIKTCTQASLTCFFHLFLKFIFSCHLYKNSILS